MKIVVFEGKDGWRYRTVADNGEKLTVSEAYSSKSKALRATDDFLTALREVPVEVED